MENLMPLWLSVVALFVSTGSLVGSHALMKKVQNHHFRNLGRLDHAHTKFAVAFFGLWALRFTSALGIGCAVVHVMTNIFQ